VSDRRVITPPRREEDPGSDRTEMRIGFAVSVTLHSTILALLVFGIPIAVDPRTAIEQIVPVDFVTIAEKPAAPKVEPPKPQPKPPEPPKEVKQEPPAAIPPPPPPPPPVEAKQPEPPKVEPPKPEPPPPPEPPKIVEAPKPEPPKPPPPKPPEPKKVEAQKPPPKPEPKKEPPKQDDFMSVLKTVEKLKPATQPQLTPPQPRVVQPPPPPQQTALNYAAQLTGSELDSVRDQFKPCWNPNFGGRNAQDLVVEIEIYANPDGTIMKAQPRQNLRMASDPFYASARDAAMRAVLNPRCAGIGGVPLKLPREKYEQWKAFVLVFDPKAMLGM
jgi:hypothetical protein